MPKLDTHMTEQAPTNTCPRCKRLMRFIKSIPRLGPSTPELRIFVCPGCEEVDTKEVERAARA